MAFEAIALSKHATPRTTPTRARAGARALPIDIGVPNDNPLEPLAVNSPLTIEIAYASTGEPEWKRDLLITSTVKKLPVFNAAPRAVNAILPNMRDGLNGRFDGISSGLNSTPVIYHSPGQADRGVVVAVEMVWNSFDNELVQNIGGLLGTAAGIPLFGPANAYLLAGSVFVKALGNLFERIVDGQAFFTDTLIISLKRPGLANTDPSYYVLYQNSIQIDRYIRTDKVNFDPDLGLVDKATGEAVTLTDPYVVLVAYGNPRPDYANFTPTMASAAILEKFYHQKQSEQPFGTELLDLLKGVSNVAFRSRATDLLTRARGLDRNAPTYATQLAEIKAEFDALNKNIGDEGLRLPWPL